MSGVLKPVLPHK